MKILHSFIVLAALATTPFALAQEPAPKPQQQEPKPAPVYDEAADARADLTAALARAKQENRRVLIQWGANWCGWCVALHGTMKKDPAIARKLMYEYDVVRVDVGRFDKHMDLAKELGADFKSTGIPFLTVLDADGKPLAQQETGALELADKSKTAHDTAKVLDFLTAHQAKYLEASAVRSAAFERATREGKRVLEHFGAPW